MSGGDEQTLRARLERLLAADLTKVSESEPLSVRARQLAKQYAPTSSMQPVLRTVHHFACTGGTLLGKCIAVMPCVRLLSEVDPLSTMTRLRAFAPMDLAGLAAMSSRPLDDAGLVRIFLAGLDVLARDSRLEGRDLVLRDHSHSHFCFGDMRFDRPSLRDILTPHYPLLSLLWVRHPLDSFLSLVRQNWVRFEPATIEEYAGRYNMFLDHYAELDVLRYEDFVTAPESSMQRVCSILQLAYNPDFQALFPARSLSGDSGRSGSVISLRPRRDIPDGVRNMLADAPAYRRLCLRLGYAPDADSPPILEQDSR